MATANLSDIRSYFRALLKALDAIHEIGFVHRDVKPGNFLIQSKDMRNDGKMDFRLVDFGLAQRVHKTTSLYSFSLHMKSFFCSDSFGTAKESE